MQHYNFEEKKRLFVSIPQAVSTVATVKSTEEEKGGLIVSIPQAVSTVATVSDNTLGKIYKVSIPQAVSTVATDVELNNFLEETFGFNTASGKYCCNLIVELGDQSVYFVSIPQAVSTVATAGPRKPVFMELKIRF